MTWFTILGMACITFLNRFIFLSPGFVYTPGEKLNRFLSFSSLAVLTAIWVPMVVRLDTTNGVMVVGWDYVFGAVIAGCLTAFKFHSFWVVVISSLAFFGFRYWLI